MARYVILGSGPAGVAACESIRAIDKSADIIMVSDDPFGYYSRPGLAYLLTGEVSQKLLFPFSDKDFTQLRIYRVKARGIELRPATHQVVLDSKKLLSYDRLLLATGAQAAPLKSPGAELKGVVKLDNLTDARHIIDLSRKARSAVVVGGGITALELVEGLLANRVQVNYLLRGDRYWSNVLDEVESQIVEGELEHHGVRLHKNTEIAEILGKKGQVSGVRTTDGRTIPCNLVAFAIGIRPRIELAKNAGLQCDRGILVDQYMHTSAEDIWAAGDCAQVFDPASGRHIIDSLWGPAREQGRAAGMNMAGQPRAYVKTIPYNVTRLANLTTTLIGNLGSGSDPDLDGQSKCSIARGDSETWRHLPDAIATQSGFDINHLRLEIGERTILGAVVMGDQKLSIPLQHIIEKRLDISPIRQKLLEQGAPLAEVLIDYWNQWKNN